VAIPDKLASSVLQSDGGDAVATGGTAVASVGRDKHGRSCNGQDARCASAARVDARPPGWFVMSIPCLVGYPGKNGMVLLICGSRR